MDVIPRPASATPTSSAAHQTGTPAAPKFARLIPTTVSQARSGSQSRSGRTIQRYTLQELSERMERVEDARPLVDEHTVHAA